MVNFHDLYRRYAQDVYRFALWLSGSPIEADDITSETFVRAFTASDRIRVMTVKGYLLTIARNLYLQSRRATRRHTQLTPDILALHADPAEIVVQRLELDMLLQAIQSLAELDRAAFLMRTDAALTYEEIACALNISIASAKVKVHRVRKKLLALAEAMEEVES